MFFALQMQWKCHLQNVSPTKLQPMLSFYLEISVPRPGSVATPLGSLPQIPMYSPSNLASMFHERVYQFVSRLVPSLAAHLLQTKQHSGSPSSCHELMCYFDALQDESQYLNAPGGASGQSSCERKCLGLNCLGPGCSSVRSR